MHPQMLKLFFFIVAIICLVLEVRAEIRVPAGFTVSVLHEGVGAAEVCDRAIRVIARTVRSAYRRRALDGVGARKIAQL